jgi:cytochrome bd ubiquinol oxidase subunit II
MHLYNLWFVAIAVLWVGYFFLEGFDFGVGILTRVLAKSDTERRVLINTIGPVWDGNEVWLITAAGATFAAFPEWYASLFSGFYLPLLLILLALIVRGVAFEYRGKGDTDQWRQRWDLAIFWGSLIPAILWGLVFANIVRGMKLDARHLYVGSLFDLLNPYALLGGLVTLGLFLVHGSVFLALKTTGDLRVRANRLAARMGPVVAVLTVIFLGILAEHAGRGLGLVAMIVLAVLAVGCFGAALGANRVGREGWAFALSGATIVLGVTALFVALYPNVLPSTLNDSYSLTMRNAASTPKALGVMTWAAAIFLPLVLAYQAWTYWVFRKRIGVEHIPARVPAHTT